MKAMICRQWGGPEDLRLEDVAPPPLGDGQVRIRIKAAGVSFDQLVLRILEAARVG